MALRLFLVCALLCLVVVGQPGGRGRQRPYRGTMRDYRRSKRAYNPPPAEPVMTDADVASLEKEQAQIEIE